MAKNNRKELNKRMLERKKYERKWKKEERHD
jgi:hypothetical protein